MNRIRRIAAVLGMVVLGATASARGAAPGVDRSQVPTGILYDLTTPIAHIERFDGTSAAPSANPGVLRQAAFELRRASFEPGAAFPSDETLRDHGSLTVRIGMIDMRYNRITDEAKQSGAARVENGQLVLPPGSVETRRAFLAAPVRGYTYRGGDVTFVLDSSVFVGHTRAARVEIDFGDGAGYRDVAWNQPVDVHYSMQGDRVVHVRANDAVASFSFEVRALTTPAPNDTIPLTGTQSYNGGTATGRAFVYLSDQHTQLTRPAVVFEGFDIDNTMNWDELYALLNQQNLVEDLRTRGYDIVVLDFTDATDYIERNAFVAVDLLHKVQAATDSWVNYPLVGPSMGGLVARYALSWMEQNNDPHRVRNLICFDVPNRGADIPLGIQYWLNFFSGNSPDAASLLSRLNTPGAREMLIYHYTTPAGSTGQADPLRATFVNGLAALGNYPTQPRRVALSNGSGIGANQGFAAGAQIIQYVYNIPLIVNVKGNVWAVPDNTSTKIFDGANQTFGSGPTQIVTVSGTAPWDNAPGGSRDSMAQMDAVVPPVGDIIALYPSHCFIPTVSALDINTPDPFYDIAGDPDLLAHTPFANIYVPDDNQPHVTVTPENAPWLLDEIDPASTAVGPSVHTPAFTLLGVAPNPFGEQTSVRFNLARNSRVHVDVFDVAGRRVATLLDGVRPAGTGDVRWAGRDARGLRVAAGVYFVRVQAVGETRTQRIVLVR
ncbi:MAG TPA: FlgD immunoglobulin-like domain containing protein [Candidatus Krumholzibacteria bacterium]|nr:FlgD immunoglobulin-like domain containing protein [Candidatus Krumholzibacteria bacterium]